MDEPNDHIDRFSVWHGVLMLVSWGVPPLMTLLLCFGLPSLSTSNPVTHALIRGFPVFLVAGFLFVVWRLFCYRMSPRCLEYRFFRWLYLLFPFWAPVAYYILSDAILDFGRNIIR